MLEELNNTTRRWLVTGAAGFIGGHLVEALLRADQIVVGIDNLSTGDRKNLEQIQRGITETQWKNLTFIQGDIRDLAQCHKAADGCDIILHHAAMVSVPRSIEDPQAAHDVNVNGFLNILTAAREADVKRVVYATSSSVYGDRHELPAIESRIGNPLSPYAATKRQNEEDALRYAEIYGLETIGLRYFNVFGPRQNPNGAYAAVIPHWITAIKKGDPIQINGDGSTTRDFLFVGNVVQANLRAALVAGTPALNRVYNIAQGNETSLKQLADLLMDYHGTASEIQYAPFRKGDILHSLADISAAKNLLDYDPKVSFADGLKHTFDWY